MENNESSPFPLTIHKTYLKMYHRPTSESLTKNLQRKLEKIYITKDFLEHKNLKPCKKETRQSQIYNFLFFERNILKYTQTDDRLSKINRITKFNKDLYPQYIKHSIRR